MLPRQEWWHAFLRSRPDISILPDQASVRLFGIGIIRADGRKIHDMYLREVKSPEESKYPGDFLKTRATIPAAEAFRPLNEGGCPLVNG